jgi:hypothetical protein
MSSPEDVLQSDDPSSLGGIVRKNHDQCQLGRAMADELYDRLASISPARAETRSTNGGSSRFGRE